MTQPTAKKMFSNKQIKYLRGLGHSITPVVLIGKEGLSDGVIEAVDLELSNHELIKVKISTNSDVHKTVAADIIPLKTSCTLIQLIGKTLLLYRHNPKKPKEKRISIPKY